MMRPASRPSSSKDGHRSLRMISGDRRRRLSRSTSIKTMWKPGWPGSVPSHECSSSYAPRSGFPGTWLRGQDSLECRVLSAEHSGQFFSQGLRKAWSLRVEKECASDLLLGDGCSFLFL